MQPASRQHVALLRLKAGFSEMHAFRRTETGTRCEKLKQLGADSRLSGETNQS